MNEYLSVGCQKYAVSTSLCQMPVHIRELKFVLEIGYRSQPANDHGQSVVLTSEVDSQSLRSPLTSMLSRSPKRTF